MRNIIPASITKILTTLVAIENNDDLYGEVTFSGETVNTLEEGSTHIGIQEGETLPLIDVLYAIMLESANEVCLAVAEHISGSVDAFVELMNQRPPSLAAPTPISPTPTLPDENHYTTAHDMALIAQAAYSHPLFSQICQTQTYVIPKTNMCGEERWLNNHHKMLPEGAYAYDGCTGGKTGFTPRLCHLLHFNNRKKC